LLQALRFFAGDVGFMLLGSQVCRDAIDLPAKSGEQLHAALPTLFPDVAGDLAFFLHLVEGPFQFDINFEQAGILCSQRKTS